MEPNDITFKEAQAAYDAARRRRHWLTDERPILDETAEWWRDIESVFDPRVPELIAAEAELWHRAADACARGERLYPVN